ncbi:MAG: hypothetical protein DMF63_00705 [Acidobacteria bacterium]|nr:MAG: hypothetical protein DMF63_00705 [Acidobacteriota bacterium]
MDFKAVIEFVKYTLALTAACFAYSVEKLVPQSTQSGRCLVLCILVVFAGAAFAGVFIFAASTAALHGDEKRTTRLRPRVMYAGYTHVALLVTGLVLLSGMLVYRVLNDAPKLSQIRCEPAASTSEK